MSTTRPTTGTRLARALVCAMLGAACGPQTGGGTVTPGTSGSGGSDPDPQGVTEGEGMGELRKRLGDLVDRERGLRPVATSAYPQLRSRAVAPCVANCMARCAMSSSVCPDPRASCSIAWR